MTEIHAYKYLECQKEENIFTSLFSSVELYKQGRLIKCYTHTNKLQTFTLVLEQTLCHLFSELFP